MTLVPHDAAASASDSPWRSRVAAGLREFWRVMCATHHGRIPS